METKNVKYSNSNLPLISDWLDVTDWGGEGTATVVGSNSDLGMRVEFWQTLWRSPASGLLLRPLWTHCRPTMRCGSMYLWLRCCYWPDEATNRILELLRRPWLSRPYFHPRSCRCYCFLVTPLQNPRPYQIRILIRLKRKRWRKQWVNKRWRVPRPNDVASQRRPKQRVPQHKTIPLYWQNAISSCLTCVAL